MQYVEKTYMTLLNYVLYCCRGEKDRIMSRFIK